MSKPWLLVSPASRGLGLALARRLLQTTDLPLIATARNDLNTVSNLILDDLGVDSQRLEVLKLDVTDESTISEVASRCKSRFVNGYLRLAFCVPGILHPERSPSQVSHSKALSTFEINTLGPLLLSKHFAPLLPSRKMTLDSIPGVPARSAVLALMSARVGSTSDNGLGGWYSYRASKAAVNSIAKSVDIYLRQSCGGNAMCISLHPGTVKTRLSQEFWGSTPKEKLFTPDFAAEKLIQVVKDIELDGRGKCWDWEGKEIAP